MIDKFWEKYSTIISGDNPLDTTRSKGSIIIYAPKIAESLGLDRDTIFYFTWRYHSAILRVYESESCFEEYKKYNPVEISEKIEKGITLPNRNRPDFKDRKYWYEYTQNKRKEWGKEEDRGEIKSQVIEVNPIINIKNDAQLHHDRLSKPDTLAGLQNNLMDRKDEIYKYFYTTDEQWKKLTEGIYNSNNESIWTFLVSCGYAMGKKNGIEMLTKLLTGSDLKQPPISKIWIEGEPISPRLNEGNTHVDLAIGAIAGRKGTKSGIRYDGTTAPWICFCEAKFSNDISLSVKYDTNRNQLVRDIENAICFQDSGIYAENVYVTIVTPRFYEYKRSELELKYKNYQSNPAIIKEHLDACHLNKRNSDDWKYPNNLFQRIRALKIQRVYFEDLVENLPGSEISEQIKLLWNKTLKRI